MTTEKILRKMDVAEEMGKVFIEAADEQQHDSDPILSASCHARGLVVGSGLSEDDAEARIKIARQLFKAYIKGIRAGAKEHRPTKKKTPGVAILSTPASILKYFQYARTPRTDEDGTLEIIMEHLPQVAKTLLEDEAAVKGEGYGYTPLDGTLTSWIASDGSEVKTDSLLGLLCEALGGSVDSLECGDCWEMHMWFLMPAAKCRNQMDFEAGY